MRAILRITLLIATVLGVALTSANAQRVLKGIVYVDGEPAAGVTVRAHKGGTMMTSFDGAYEVEATAKSKYIEFTMMATGDSKKMEIEGKSGDNFDFAFSGSLPSDGAGGAGAGVNLSSAQELMDAKDRDFMNDLSLYLEFYKQKNYEAAKPHWKNLYNKYPKSTQNIYIHGSRMYQTWIENADTDAQKDKLIDEYMKLYDQRIKYFGQEGYVLGRKGTNWLKFKLHESRSSKPEGDALKEVHKKAYEWLSASVKERGNETEPPVIVLYMQTTFALFKLDELPKETVVMNYEESMNICKAIVSENKDAETVAQINETVIPFIDENFGKSGAADCEALISIFTPQFEEKGQDVEFVKSMLRRLRRAGCDESALYENATVRLYELEPSAEAAFNMARRYLKKEDTENAKKYYQQAMEQETDQELLASYYYEYGRFILGTENNLQEARNYARKALAAKPDYCEANALIGDIYLEASRNFPGDDFEKKAVFWLACDYFNKAKRGENCAKDAGEKAARYKAYFPNKEEAFMRSIQEGHTYKVEGWINETTKARF